MNKQITIHGLGYVGLTAAVHWAKAGWQAFGYDPDRATTDAVMAGTPRGAEFLSYLHADIKGLVERGRIDAGSSEDYFLASLASPVHLIAVPSERNDEPYMEIVGSVLFQLHEEALEDTVVLIESTLQPGTMDLLKPKLTRKDFHVAVCPRRDWFADQSKNLTLLPRVCGGLTDEATRRAVELLRVVSADVTPTTYRTAELTKALENALLHVPVMLAAELALAYHEHDVHEALRLACTHWRLMPLYLSMGTGGRCVPLGTKYLIEGAGGRYRNASTTRPLPPQSVLCAAEDRDKDLRQACALAVTNRGLKSALVLGVAYRPDFKDAGCSPGLAIARHLRAHGAEVELCDPMFTVEELFDFGVATSVADMRPGAIQEFMDYFGGHPPPALRPQAAAMLLATPHTAFLDWPERKKDWRNVKFVLDGQGTWRKYASLFAERGIEYKQVGEAGWRG